MRIDTPGANPDSPVASPDNNWRDDDHRERVQSESPAADPWHVPPTFGKLTALSAPRPDGVALDQSKAEESTDVGRANTPGPQPEAHEAAIIPATQTAKRESRPQQRQLGLPLIPADDLFATAHESLTPSVAGAPDASSASFRSEAAILESSAIAQAEESLPFPKVELEKATGASDAAGGVEPHLPDEWAALESAESDDVDARTKGSSVERDIAPDWNVNPNAVPEVDRSRTSGKSDESDEIDDSLLEETLFDLFPGDAWSGRDSAAEGNNENAGNAEFDASVSADDGDVYLFDFDETAQQRPWELPDEQEASLVAPREKAAAIASLVDVTTREEQTRLLGWLTELFTHLKHPATFAALKRAAQRGLTFDTLHAMVSLRQSWMEHPEWWVGRYGYARNVGALTHGPAALSWVLARAICESRSEYPPETMIDGDWLDEWYNLQPGEPGYISFPAFIIARLSSVDARFLDSALAAFERGNEGVEFGDDRNAYRWLPNLEDAVRSHLLSFNPFNRRENELLFGPIPDDSDEGDADD